MVPQGTLVSKMQNLLSYEVLVIAKFLELSHKEQVQWQLQQAK